MGNNIDCKYVCQEPQLKQQLFLVNVNPFGVPSQHNPPNQSQQPHPLQSFAKPVSRVLSLNEKVRDAYQSMGFNLLQIEIRTQGQQLLGMKLGPHYIYQMLAYYDGEWMNGNIHGKGTLYFDNGSLMEGVFHEGDGVQVVLILPNGKFQKTIMTNEKLQKFGSSQMIELLKPKEQLTKEDEKETLKEKLNQLQEFIQKRKRQEMMKQQNSRTTNQCTQLTQMSDYSKISRPQPSNHLKKNSSLKLNNVAKSPTSSCFPRKLHFRKISSTQSNFQQLDQPKPNTSIRIQRLRSQTSKEKKPIKIVCKHKRGMSACSNNPLNSLL